MIVICRTPMRISLFGGGTDYPEYFSKRPGAVIGLAIDKYIYIAALRTSGTQGYHYRVSYSQVETVDKSEEIQHRAVREAFTHYQVRGPLDVSIMADMPASSGLGSSSTFAVGLLNLISHLKAERITKLDLALRAIHLERELIRENVGVQDQMHAAFGGINRFDFQSENYRITPLLMGGSSLQLLLDSLVLVHTGIIRHASVIVSTQVEKTKAGVIDTQLRDMMEIVNEGERALRQLQGHQLVTQVAAMLQASWHLKRTLSPHVSSDVIDGLYERCIAAGALGGKLCGAGGGGFFLMVVPPEQRARFEAKVAPHKVITLGLDTSGSTIIHSQGAG